MAIIEGVTNACLTSKIVQYFGCQSKMTTNDLSFDSFKSDSIDALGQAADIIKLGQFSITEQFENTIKALTGPTFNPNAMQKGEALEHCLVWIKYSMTSSSTFTARVAEDKAALVNLLGPLPVIDELNKNIRTFSHFEPTEFATIRQRVCTILATDNV